MSKIRGTKLLQKIALGLKKLRDEIELTQEQVYNDTNRHVGRIETAKAKKSLISRKV